MTVNDTYILERSQHIPRPLHEVFAFFADARNLESITPPWLRFRIVRVTDNEIRRGTLIRYELRWLDRPASLDD